MRGELLLPDFEGAQNRGMHLRAYRPEDFEAIYALDVASFAPPFRFSRQTLWDAVTAPGSLVVVASESPAEGAAVLGFCAGLVEEIHGAPVVYVASLDVSPTQRRLGLGRALMLALERSAGRLGASRITLHVFVGNGGAVALYESLGYLRLSLHRGYYGAGYDAWEYRKALVLGRECRESSPAS